VAGLVKKRTGVGFWNGLLGGEDHEMRIELDTPAVMGLSRNGGRIWESCGNCLDGERRRGGGRANVNSTGNVLRWMLG
jgi:hypothetical protein